MVPEGWKDGRVTDLIAKLEAGVSVNGVDRPLTPGEVGVLRVSSVTYGTFNPSAAKAIIADDISRAKCNPRAGQVIVSRSNTEDLVGASAYISKDHPNLYLSDKLWQTVPKPMADMKWLSYVLAAERSRYLLSNLATGTSGSMKNITKDELLTMKILIPPALEQKKIAAILSTWDDAISANEDLLANSRLRKKTLMHQLLTGKKRLQGFDGEWSRNDLKNISKFYRGRQLSKVDLDETGRYPAIHYGELFTKYSEVITRIVSRTNKIEGQFLSTANDVLMPTSDVTPNGLARASAINKEGVVIGGDVMVIRINDGHSPNFFSYLLNYSKREILRVATGTTVFHIYGSDIGKLNLAFPGYKEQCTIVEILTTANEEIEALEQRINNLKLQKKALMQQLLTGKKRVKVEPVTA